LRDLEGAGLIDKQEDLDEMEKWLMEQESGATGGPSKLGATKTSSTTTATVDNSDFEKFLYERAVAADNLPSSASSQSRQQQSKKPESDPFGL
jgi:hypothetical protein